MPTDNTSQKPPHKPTRLERALLRQNLYIPPRMKSEIEDALKAIAVEQGCQNSDDLNEYEVRIESEAKKSSYQDKVGKLTFRINIFGYLKKGGEAERIADHVVEFVNKMKAIDPKYKTIEYLEFDNRRQRLIMECPDLRTLLDSVVEGYINKVIKDPEGKIDVDAIMNEPRTWVDITSGGGQGSGGPSTGGLGGGA